MRYATRLPSKPWRSLAMRRRPPDTLQVPDGLLASFPLVWEGVSGWGVGGWVTHLFRWLFTAAAVSLGAPFWFDLLSRVAKLRGTGRRPGGGG